MIERTVACGGHIYRYGNTYHCSQSASFAVRAHGSDTWRSACGHHLAQVVTELSTEHGSRLEVVNLRYEEPAH